MKSKTPLFFAEQLIMLLVFALAAALCLRCFALAGDISRRSQTSDRAVALAQNAAETVKACSGDWQKAAELLSGSWNGEVLTADCENDLRLTVTPAESSQKLMSCALVRVSCGEEELFSITVSWQEVTAGG